jgi:RNA polymerase sigma-70 factor (ECF subfamily)
MTEQDSLAERFEEHRTRLRAVAYRMLGSLSQAGDAVREAPIRIAPVLAMTSAAVSLSPDQ